MVMLRGREVMEGDGYFVEFFGFALEVGEDGFVFCCVCHCGSGEKVFGCYDMVVEWVDGVCMFQK